jgi:hypothetical protein
VRARVAAPAMSAIHPTVAGSALVEAMADPAARRDRPRKRFPKPLKVLVTAAKASQAGDAAGWSLAASWVKDGVPSQREMATSASPAVPMIPKYRVAAARVGCRVPPQRSRLAERRTGLGNRTRMTSAYRRPAQLRQPPTLDSVSMY